MPIRAAIDGIGLAFSLGGVPVLFLGNGVLSVASMVGFITLFGIATRNGVLLVTHYQNIVDSSLPRVSTKTGEPHEEPGCGRLVSDKSVAGRLVEGATMEAQSSREEELLRRITVDPKIFGGKPIIRGRRLAVEHILGMLAAGDGPETILAGYPWLEAEDIQACLVYARRLVGHERVEPALGGTTRVGHAAESDNPGQQDPCWRRLDDPANSGAATNAMTPTTFQEKAETRVTPRPRRAY